MSRRAGTRDPARLRLPRLPSATGDPAASVITVTPAQQALLDDLRAGEAPDTAWAAYRQEHRNLLEHYIETWSLPQPDSGWPQAVGAFADLLAARADALDLEQGLDEIVELVCPRRAVRANVYTLVGWGHVMSQAGFDGGSDSRVLSLVRGSIRPDVSPEEVPARAA